MESLLRADGCLVAVLFSILFAAGGRAPGDRVATPDDEMHRALGVLNYFIGDYPLAVGDEGEILNDFEYREQIGLLASLSTILAQADPGGVHANETIAALQGGIQALSRLVHEARGSEDVLGLAHDLRDTLVEAYDLVLWPLDPPSLSRGRELYGLACAGCHGTAGRGRTPVAQRLNPRPTDLLSRHLDRTLSPYQTFNVVTFGVDGTAMPAFAALTTAERWDVAFYVMAMRQRAVPRSDLPRLSPPLEILARSTDAELAAWLAEHGVPASRRASEVARLRRGQIRESGD